MALTKSLLDRLLDENLTLLPTPNQLVSRPSTKSQPKRRYASSNSLVKQGRCDEEKLDPRWLQLFQEYFIQNNASSSGNDDMLFFVRDTMPHSRAPSFVLAGPVTGAESGIGAGDTPELAKSAFNQLGAVVSTLLTTPQLSRAASTRSRVSTQSRMTEEDQAEDLVWIQRKITKPVPKMPPSIDLDRVLWRDTLFLNLIVQLPCKLTVAVCQRNAPVTPMNLNNQTLQNSASSMSLENKKGAITCTRKYVSRRVYALPRKTRVDVKDSGYVCSWPVIYYVIDDYDVAFEQLVLKEGEYLCVELSAQPFSHHPPSHSNGLPRTPATPVQGKHDKVVLFQGAAAYASLLDIYRQKSLAKSSTRYPRSQSRSHPTEYVMMRGPGGKGHAQVAITACYSEESRPSTRGSSLVHSSSLSPVKPPSVINTANPGSSSNSSSWWSGASMLKSLKKAFFGTSGTEKSSRSDLSSKTMLNNGIAAGGITAAAPASEEDSEELTVSSSADNSRPTSIKSSGGVVLSMSSSGGSRIQQHPSLYSASNRWDWQSPMLPYSNTATARPLHLKCCLTFVNVPWTSLAGDLILAAQRHRQSESH